MAPCKVGNLLKHLPGAERSGWIIWIDENNAARARIYFSLYVIEFGLPSIFFVQIIGIQLRSGFAKYGGVERIIRAWRQNVFTRIKQCGKADVHCFAGAVCDEDIPNRGDSLP